MGSNCQDYPGWIDKLGDTCTDYSLHPDWCNQLAATDPTTGIDATTACCICADKPLKPTILTRPSNNPNLPCPIGQVWGDLSQKDGALEVGTAECPSGQECDYHEFSWMFGPSVTKHQGVGQRSGCWIQTEEQTRNVNRADKAVCNNDNWCKNNKQCPNATCVVGGKCDCGAQCMVDSKSGRCVQKLGFNGVGNNVDSNVKDCRLVRLKDGVACLDSNYNSCDPSFCGIADFELKGTGKSQTGKKINVYDQKEYFGHSQEDEQSLVIIFGVTLGLLILFILIIALMAYKGNKNTNTKRRRKFG